MDWGNLAGIALQTIAIIITLVAFIGRIHLDLKLWIQKVEAIANKVYTIETKMEKISDVITQIAIQDARLNAIESRIHTIDNRLDRHIKDDT